MWFYTRFWVIFTLLLCTICICTCNGTSNEAGGGSELRFLSQMNLNPENELESANSDSDSDIDSYSKVRLVDLNVTVLLPFDPVYDPSMVRVGHAIELAFRKVRDLGLLPGIRVKFNFRDSKCSNIFAPMEAIMSALISHQASVFFGPSCELALAPVARYMKFWNTPLLTGGGLTFDYTLKKTNNESEYFLTTRTGPSFKEMADFILLLFHNFGWARVMLMYEKDGMHRVSGQHTCKHFMSTMVEFIKVDMKLHSFDFDTNSVNASLKENLASELQRTKHSASHDHSLLKILAPIRMAVESGRVRELLRGHEVEVIYRDTKCSSTYGPLEAFEFHRNKTADVFLGPVCDYVIAPVSRYAGVWNIPVLTPGAMADAFRHKYPQYPTLTRIAGSYSLVGDAFTTFLSRFRWQHVAFLYHNYAVAAGRGHSPCHFTLGKIYTALHYSPVFRSFDETQKEFTTLLKYFSTKSRIVVLCASPEKVREILLAAEELDMIANGEYVFFNVELFTRTNNFKPWYNAGDSDEENARAKKAFEAVLMVTVRQPPNTSSYLAFEEEIKRRSRGHLANVANPHGGSGPVTEPDDGELVNPIVTAFYDAVLLYAIALNESLANGGSIANGTDITTRMWGKTFEGITGNVTIDENGDRNADYSLLDMDPETGVFSEVAHYSGKDKLIVDVPNAKIHWAGNRDTWPPDTPKCGFDGSGCPSAPQFLILVVVLAATLTILLISIFVIYKHYRLEAEIASMTWRVNWQDVLTGSSAENRENRENARPGRRDSHTSLVSTYSVDTLSGGANKQIFIRTALYKMKDLHHEHLVRFVGASIDPPHCYFLTEYCPRGSLQDILENDQLKLDWTFRYSLMHDIIKGMQYLHTSEIRSHGNLKSSNCVVDSRFVLKITDFGLHSLRVKAEELDPNSYAFWRGKLWTAPEILRMSKPPPEGTQKGDIYSFAIIVHEVAARQGPFFLNEDLSPKEIVEKVNNDTILRELQPFRPSLDAVQVEDELLELMTKCWKEDPSERPDFAQCKHIIRRLNKENERGGSSLVDNLLARMEQYANNLETLVQERTAAYLEEKRKCEEVLYQLLPKSVASSLIAGQPVLAETFDSVTIYFSDIVGFTQLSAQSTPMQVVKLLNDLYTCFDSIIENFDVYKVETIGDAYMVVSGLPVRNGKSHSREIARMSLALLQRVMKFKIRHRPDEQLKLRIGINSGPVVAGVVGLKMPRYCLFGDTVNMASRMESSSLPLKIHLSQDTRDALDQFGTFIVESRGEIELKGKGKVHSFWLLGEKNDDKSGLGAAPLANSIREPPLIS